MQVIVLRALRTKLSEALAQVHAAASLLHLRTSKASFSDGDLDPSLLLDVARSNIEQCASMTTKVCKLVFLNVACQSCSGSGKFRGLLGHT